MDRFGWGVILKRKNGPTPGLIASKRSPPGVLHHHVGGLCIVGCVIGNSAYMTRIRGSVEVFICNNPYGQLYIRFISTRYVATVSLILSGVLALIGGVLVAEYLL